LVENLLRNILFQFIDTHYMSYTPYIHKHGSAILFKSSLKTTGDY